jgi:hypothetical protein
MNKLLKRAIAVMGLIAFMQAIGAETNPARFDFEYMDPVGIMGSIKVGTHTGEVVAGGISWKLQACPEKFKCLVGGPIQFAVPDSFQPDSFQKEWSAFGQHYVVVGKHEARVLGVITQISVIKSVRPTFEMVYLYSQDLGLVSFGSTKAPLFWLEGRCGFAANHCP